MSGQLQPSRNAKRSKTCIVLGAGIVGINIAHALAERGVRVVLVDKDRVGSGTSTHSFAWINATSKTADPDYHRLNASGAEHYRSLAKRFGERRIGHNPVGMLQWARPEQQDKLSEIRNRFDRLREYDYPVLWVDSAQLCAMEPHLRIEPESQGLFAPADAWLDAPRYLSAMAERIRILGGRILEYCAATELMLDDEGVVRGVHSTRGPLAGDDVIIATGPGTPEVLARLTGFEAYASRFPLRQVPGLLVRTPAGDARRLARHILYTPDPGHLHIRDAGAGSLLLGADDTDGMIAEDQSLSRQKKAAAELLRRTANMIEGFAGESLLDACQIGIGVRPYPEDGKTIAGPVPAATGLHLVATHSGITMGAVLGDLIAQCVISGQLPTALEPFSLARFQRFA